MEEAIESKAEVKLAFPPPPPPPESIDSAEGDIDPADGGGRYSRVVEGSGVEGIAYRLEREKKWGKDER